MIKKKKIAILGSTGSIGKNTLEVIKKDIKNFDVTFLSANTNYKLLLKQAKNFKVKNIIIHDLKTYEMVKNKLKKRKINIFFNVKNIEKIIKKKIDYTMCSISGLEGLHSTLQAISFSKNVAIANKESIICGWPLIKKKLKKFNTNFIPVDSEHFSIWNLTKEYKNKDIKEIIITASGGPFLNYNVNKLKNVKPHNAIKHPKWSMGKKISVDSSTLMNKVFETIEAFRMFDFDFNKYKVLIHPNSYVHAIVKFNNGLIKFLIHDTDMKIPIFNSLYLNEIKTYDNLGINSKKISNLKFYNVNKKKFPSINILKKIPKKHTLFETVLVSANDELVSLFLDNKIKYLDMHKKLIKIINDQNIKKEYSNLPFSMNSIVKLNKLVRLKARALSV
jgi:1-deoxy-D-xylulose-5-phosphate reductoisomerase